MQKNIMTFSSLTYAMKGREMLNQNNIYSTLIRTPVSLKVSCGYSLYIPKNMEKATEILTKGKIKFTGIYSVDFS